MKKNIILTAFSLLLLYGCTGDMERIQTGTNTEELIYADAAKTRQILNNLYARTVSYTHLTLPTTSRV